ncbi:DUF3859 domain-containing protein [uncultured Pelagimonas sp.]|uniref:DUF3859 domain-containing protein n=1 Tax=uncultured Pelagimonas sp. TaxID=1618102 RepID=UPI002615B731|nr:DUF3859 domain-containing protein [uncultured Pelagimonas sp.]
MFRFAILALLVPSVLVAEDVSPVSLLDHGVICEVTQTGTEAAPETASGVINLIDQTRVIDVTTQFVPAHIGLSFGLRTKMSADAVLNGARMRIIHPPMGANGITEQSWAAPMQAGEAALNLYTFEQDDELLLGVWTFQVIFADKVLIEQRFEVVPQGTVPVVQQVCFGASLTS